jgi:hypothetical protein
MIFPYQAIAPMTEIVEWLTDVIESYDGSESRAMLRNAPRHHYHMSHIIPYGGYAKNLLSYIQAGQVDIPLWHMAAPISVSAGATVIATDTRYADYQKNAIIWQSPHHCELVEIDSKTDSSLTLADPVVGSYHGFIAPGRTVKAGNSVSGQDLTGWISELSLNWFCTENYRLTGLELNKYLGADVVPWPILIGAEREIVRPMEWIDFGTGVVQTDSRLDYSRFNTNARIYLDGFGDAWNFRRWLHQLKGRVESFWMPSFAHDVIVEPFGASDTVLNINNAGLTLETVTHLAFIQESGIICRTVTDAAVSGDGEVITINAALGFAGDMTDFKAISFLHLCRLGGDVVELTWQRPDLVEANFPVVML